MKFTELSLPGAYVIEPELKSDDRGFFARVFCQKELEELGLDTNLVQANISFNHKAGTLRGMHFQKAPHQETKIVRCTKGSIYDVMIDLRPESATFKQWAGVELTEDNHKMLYVPKGFAHGYLTLTDNAEVQYFVSEFYAPESETGARYNDQAFGIEWPIEITTISDRDLDHPDFGEEVVG